MKRFTLVVAAGLMAGCLSSRPTAPAPVSFHSSRSAKEATQAAAITLTGAGFRVETLQTYMVRGPLNTPRGTDLLALFPEAL